MTNPPTGMNPVSDEKQPARFLDITGELCPMTFVRTKLALERMKPGEMLVVRLKAGEALRNVPRSCEELGHHVRRFEPEATGHSDGVHVLWIERG